MVLVAGLWAVPGLVFSGDIAALLGWSNPVEGVSGICMGALCLCALFLTNAARGRGLRRWHVYLGPVGFAAGYLFTMVAKAVDPSVVHW